MDRETKEERERRTEPGRVRDEIEKFSLFTIIPNIHTHTYTLNIFLKNLQQNL